MPPPESQSASLAESLHASEARFRAAFDHAVVGMVLTDLHGAVVRVNEAFCRIVGRTEAQLMAQTSHEYTHPDDRDNNVEAIRQVREGLAPSASYSKRYVYPDGGVVWAQINLSAVRDPEGRPVNLIATVEDVTEHKRAQIALQERENDFRLLLGSITDYAIITIDPEGTITGWNAGAELAFGYRAEEILGRKSVILWTEEDRASGAPELHRREARRLGKELSERWQVRKDGSRFYATVVTRPMYTADGRLKGFAKVCRDITEQRHEEQERERVRQEAGAAVERERARLFEAFHNSPSFLAVLQGPEHVFVMVNERYLQLVGHRDILQKTVREALPEIEGQGYFEILDRVYQTGVPFEGKELPALIQRTPGAPPEKRFLDLVYQPMRDAGGDIVGIFAHGVDATDRILAQQTVTQQARTFDVLLSAIRDYVFILDRAGRFTYANQVLLDLWGRTAEQAFGRSMGELDYPPEVRARLGQDLETAFVTHRPITGEVAYTSPTGVSGYFEYILAPVVGADGAVEIVAGTSRDISERRRAEMEREQLLHSERAARTEAERASSMKDEFLATVSHELRTPLNAILGWASILRESPTSEDTAQAAEVIERNARAQAKIIEDLLDMSRIMSGKVRLDVQHVDLAPIVQAAVETVLPAAEAKGVRLEAVLDPQARPVSGDPNRLQQVFWNLLSNAVKFTPRGGKVQVLLERVNSHLEVSVIDTGEGIAPKFLPHVFERFRQADASSTRKHGGLGLGLAIVKQLVELHGGSVRVKSAGLGFGSTFSVALPLKVVHELPGEEPERRHPSAGPSVPPEVSAGLTLRGVKVLVVDDEPDARALVARLLGGYEAHVRTAGSAREGMEALAAERPDVIVSDIGMPAEDGYTFIRRIRALPPEAGGQIPALALTAYARSEDRMRAVLAGFQMHVPKPVEAAELVTMVASLAGRRTT